MTAKEITAGLLCAIPKHFPARVWRRNVGAAVAGDRFIRFSLPGEADITGIIEPGIRLEIEVKAGKDRLTPEQVSFLAMVEKHGGIALVAHDVDTAIAELRKIWEARRS
ncbi:MAG: VRR-NUC domain-containing protein [Patescibacteria group bacterium]|nr:VRR-NUC domain-containing protein [Patescibacteria group bacterium]